MNSFKQSLEQILSEAGLPEDSGERLEAFSKIFDLTKYEANEILNGKRPEEDLLKRISEEFETDIEKLRKEKNSQN